MSIYKTRYKIYKNAVLCMMIEPDRGCAHLIFPYGVCMGTLRFFSVDGYWIPCCINMNVVSQFVQLRTC
jgi:hypothetical protein